ncbi:MAG: CheR family methyltransferase, partial [Candidatus Eisenbacteria bacterium]|nr:CheR family methyltransferase [Candidatus Eisenbacteria bacterium]
LSRGLGDVYKRQEWGEKSDRDTRILATDISSRVLERAKRALYEEAQLAEVPDGLRRRYFTLERDPGGQSGFRVCEPARRLVRFARLNLMDAWPMHGPFDMIFCRNVMIYFDRETQQRLIARFYELLREGGYFFVGHSESLSGRAGALRYVMPAVYRK